eukprot:1956223-Rhodomonas_salina.1
MSVRDWVTGLNFVGFWSRGAGGQICDGAGGTAGGAWASRKAVVGSSSCVQGGHAVPQEEYDHEIEVFVHGALCVSYSGQCFSSEAWGGRSANRGQCAQACRLPYTLVLNGTHCAYVLQLSAAALYWSGGCLDLRCTAAACV